MHLQVHFASELIHELSPSLRRSPVPVMIDHRARVDASLGAGHADFAALHALLGSEHCWVKVSGVDRICRTGDYGCGVELARLLVEAFPDRCVWGTDWPHLNHHLAPDDDTLAG